MGLQRRLDHSNQIHPPNFVFHKCISELRHNKDLPIYLSSIYLKYNEHLKKHGPNIAFPMTPYEVYQYLKLLDVNLKSTIVINNDSEVPSDEHSPTSEGLYHTPVARAAYVQVEEKTLYPDKEHTKHITKAKSQCNRCTICNDYHPTGPNPEMRSPAHGETWTPDWKRKAAAKYNAIHPNYLLDPDFISASLPVRSGTTKPTTR